jgi:hypothetical protein
MAGARTFLTNDAQLARVAGMQVLVVDQLLTNPGSSAAASGPAAPP